MKKENSGTKTCKHCKTEIPYDAKVCPQCRKKQKGGILKWLLIVIVLVIIIGVVIGSSSDDKKVKNVTPKNNSTDTTKESSGSNEKTEFSVGEVAEYDGVQVSVLDYEEATGDEWTAPDDGKIFVYVNIEIVNNTDGEISVSSMMSFDSYCDDYKLDYSSNALMAASADNKQQLDGSIAAGKKMNGYLGLEVPVDWKTIEINYKDNVWLDSNFKFIINK